MPMDLVDLPIDREILDELFDDDEVDEATDQTWDAATDEEDGEFRSAEQHEHRDQQSTEHFGG